MSGVPKLDSQLEKEFLRIVKTKYHGDIGTAFNRAIEYFITFEGNMDQAMEMAEKITDLRMKIRDLREINQQTTKIMSEIQQKKSNEKE